MPAHKKGDRVVGPLGPYKPGSYYLVFVHVNGDCERIRCATLKEAESVANGAHQRLARSSSLTVEAAIQQYLSERGHLKQSSLDVEERSIRALLPDGAVLVRSVTVAAIEQRWAALKLPRAPRPRVCRTPRGVSRPDPTALRLRSPEYLRSIRRMFQPFARWLLQKKHCERDLMVALPPLKDKRRRGKTQLTMDEGREWVAKAYELAESGTPAQQEGAVAALTALLCRLREGEVLGLVVRDLDDGGRRLLVASDGDGKTADSTAPVKVPQDLQPYLLRQAAGKARLAPLFGPAGDGQEVECRRGQHQEHGHGRQWVLYWARRICHLAGLRPVCAHALRGMGSTFAIQLGATPEMVAQGLRHRPGSTAVAEQHYIAPGALVAQQQAVLAEQLHGGGTVVDMKKWMEERVAKLEAENAQLREQNQRLKVPS